MSKTWSTYVTELHRHFGNLIPTWLPTDSIKIGDFGTFENGLFAREGNLSDRAMVLAVRTTPATATYQYQSTGVKMARVSASGVQEGHSDAAVEIQFQGANSVYFSSTKCIQTEVESIEDLQRFVEESLLEKDWDRRWCIVTKLVCAEESTILVASNAGSKVRLRGAVIPPQQRFLAATGKLEVEHEEGIGFRVVGMGGLTPLYGLHQLKRNLLGTPRLQPRGMVPDGREVVSSRGKDVLEEVLWSPAE